ncbi:MAG: hypothetical protein JWO67_2401 [Streptosporangiaceae bacterium]|nr:hypothetical protein [Streptosporangiaceae bacterium]
METTTKTLAWHGDPALKAEVMERMRAHRADDAIVQGTYQRIDPEAASGYRGCAIGCTLPQQPAVREGRCDCGCESRPEVGWHGEVERLYGIDMWIGHAIDDVFEGLDPTECGDFAVNVIDVIPVGADLSDLSDWAHSLTRRGFGKEEAPDIAADLIERLRNAPVPTPA